jgi:hypothetical protein
MKVLVACEFSGRVRDAFISKGHDVISCDLLPSESEFGHHYQGDINDIINEYWDLMIAHPPCTYLTNSGVRWLYNPDKTINQVRWSQMINATSFFNKLLNANIPRICIENPIMHKHAKNLISQPYTQIIQPWQFGDNEQKSTCLWLKNLSPLKPVVTQKPGLVLQTTHQLGPSKDRWKIRSRTFQGIADAMANQWG